VGEETIAALLGKMDVISAQLEHLSEELARHQESISSLTESVMSIKLERAKERGYFLGALAVGSLLGGMIEKLFGL
jgi:chromosome segregation ATPase